MPGRANSPYAQGKCSVRSGRGEQCDERQKQEWSLQVWWRSDWQGRSPSTRRRHHLPRLPAPRRRPPSVRQLLRPVPPRRQPRRRVPPLQRQPPAPLPALPLVLRLQVKPRSLLRRRVPSPMPPSRRQLRRLRLPRFPLLCSRASTQRGSNASRTAAAPGCKAMPPTPQL